MTATAAMRSLVDAGQFANLPGGFKAKGMRIVGDNDPIAPGEFREVEATGNDLSKMIINLPYKEPSQTLFQMLNFVLLLHRSLLIQLNRLFLMQQAMDLLAQRWHY